MDEDAVEAAAGEQVGQWECGVVLAALDPAQAQTPRAAANQIEASSMAIEGGHESAVAQALGDGAGIRSGFSVVLPKALFDNRGGKSDAAVRLFALTQAGAAAELPFKQSQ